MTTLREAAQQALEALEAVCGGRCNAEYNPCWQREVAETLRAALAQQAESPCACWPGRMCSRQAQCAATVRAQQAEPVDDSQPMSPEQRQRWEELAAMPQQAEPVEPVAEARYDGTLRWLEPHGVGLHRIQGPLYTAPPQRKPLTDEDIERICMTYQSPRQAARAVERAHGITDPQIEDRLARAVERKVRGEEK